MPRYVFEIEENDKGKYAEYDEIGGGIIIYLPEITKDIDEFELFDHTGIFQNVLVELFIHEDVHQGITESGGVDTTGDQDHNVMDWIKSALYDTTY